MHPDRAIGRYLDEGLPEVEEARLRSHIANCGRCRERYDGQVLFARALAGDPGRPTRREERRAVARALSAAGAAKVAHGAARRKEGAGFSFAWLRLTPLTALGGGLAIAAAFLLLVMLPKAPAGRVTTAQDLLVNGNRAFPGDAVQAGARVEVSAGGLGELTVARGGTVRIFPGSTIVIARGGEQVQLELGRVWCQVDHNGRPFAVRTDRGEARVLGTSFVVEKRGDGDTEVRVLQGTVAVEDRKHRGIVQVRARQKTRLAKEAAPSPARAYSDLDSSDWAASLSKFVEKVGHGIEKAIDDVKKKLKTK